MQEQTRDIAAEAVAAYQRNKRETMLLYTETFRDQQLGHVRIFVKNKAGGLTPTGKGVTVTKAQLAEFTAGLQRLAEKLKALA